MKLHIGGKQVKDGWSILNIQDGEGVDFVGSCTDLRQFGDESVEEIYASHVIEHLGHGAETRRAVGEFQRVLVAGGRLYVAVPDLKELCRLFTAPGLRAPDQYRIVRLIFGGQTDEYDLHKTGYSVEILAAMLRQAGFVNIRRVSDFGLFDDTSKGQINATRDDGSTIEPFVNARYSLNVTAEKG